MSPLVGASSSSLPHASATELLAALARVGADCVDLRAGRAQNWEPELDRIADALPVAFVGVSATLGSGDGDSPAPPAMIETMIERRIAIRLFAGPLDDPAAEGRAAADVARLRARWGPDLRLLVEPHKALPTLGQLDVLLAAHGIGAVVDTLGLVRIEADLDRARAFLLRHGAAVQLKGIAQRGGEYRHVALDACPPLASWSAALVRGSTVPITIETKAGTVAEDIRTVRSRLAEPGEPPSLPQEISACVCAF